jgi:hypothetical protein
VMQIINAITKRDMEILPASGVDGTLKILDLA